MKIVGINMGYGIRKSDHISEDWHFNIREDLIRYVNKKNKIIVLPIPPLVENIKYYLNLCDGFILQGDSCNLDPKRYGEEKKFDFTTNERISKIRHNFDIKLFKKCYKLKKPILGICAGMQEMNVAMGGSLIQKLNEKNLQHHNQDWRNITSKIKIEKNSNLFKIFKKKEIKINSEHIQAINKLGKNLRISAIDSKDDIIEGIEIKNHPFAIGIQWHPEMQLTKYDQILIKEFIKKL